MQVTLDDRQDTEEDRLESTWDRWQRLPLPYRVNALLYVLGFMSLVILLAQVLSGSGGKPRQVEVASRAPSTTRAPRPSTTAAATTVPVTTAAPASTPAATATPKPATATASAAPAANVPASPSDTSPIPGFSPGAPACINSTDPQCGAFHWEPPVANNLPIVVNVIATQSATAPNEYTFMVTVSDADHQVSDNCAVVDFGDGVMVPAPCTSVSCPDAHGAWTTPPAVAGSQNFTYTHAYASPGQYTARFEYHTDRDRCPDPYGNFGSNSATVTVPGT
jgi:hypothetical protein